MVIFLQEFLHQRFRGESYMLSAGRNACISNPGTKANDYLLTTVFRNRLDALYRTQKLAAQEAGFQDLYSNKSSKNWYDWAGGEDKDAVTIWSSLYNDSAYDTATAKTAVELSQQLSDVDKIENRSETNNSS